MASAVMPLSRGTSTGTYSFTDGTSTQTLALALVNTSTNTVTIAGNPFSNGETVVYTVLSGQNIGALASGSHYTIQTSSANSFQFLDPANGNAVVPLSTVPTGTTSYALAYAAPAGDTLSLTSPDAAIGGLQTNQVYYVVSVDKDHIRLAKDCADAIAAEPIPFTSLGSGNDNTIAAAASTIGIGDAASLSSTDEGSAYPTTGQSNNGTQNLNFSTSSDVTLSGLLGGASALFKGF